MPSPRPLPAPLVKLEPQDDPADGCFIIENPTADLLLDAKAASFVSSQARAPPTEVPLRATQAPKKMKGMMGVFRINPFAMHNGSEGRGAAPTVGWEPGPLEEEPVVFEFQLDLIGYADSDDDDDDGARADPACRAVEAAVFPKLQQFPSDFDFGSGHARHCGLPEDHRVQDSALLPPSASVSPFGGFGFQHSRSTASPHCAFVRSDGTWSHDVGTVDMTTLSSSSEEGPPSITSGEEEQHFHVGHPASAYDTVIEAPSYPSMLTPSGYVVPDVSDPSLGYPAPRIPVDATPFDALYGIPSSASAVSASDVAGRVQDVPLVVGSESDEPGCLVGVVGGQVSHGQDQNAQGCEGVRYAQSRDNSQQHQQHRLYDHHHQQQQQYQHHYPHHHHHHSHSHHPYLRPTSSMSNSHHQINKLAERYHASPVSSSTTTTTRECPQMYEEYEDDSYEYEYEYEYGCGEDTGGSGKSYAQQQQQPGYDAPPHLIQQQQQQQHPHVAGHSPSSLGSTTGRVQWAAPTLHLNTMNTMNTTPHHHQQQQSRQFATSSALLAGGTTRHS